MSDSKTQRIDYMNPQVPKGLPRFDVPLIMASQSSLAGYGSMVTDYANHHVPITPWPVSGWRPLDIGTGDEGGYKEGLFDFYWQGDILFGENKAVEDKYILGWSTSPENARVDNPNPDRSKLLIWHANYHPDGGQLFYPLDNKPFIIALANTGDDMKPQDWVAFYCDGSFGVCIDPGVWHEAIFPLQPRAEFYDKQGAVHARVSADFPREFGVLLAIPTPLSANIKLLQK
ncbi:ureidoglycolate hydrolase ['Osedax' symbiont bacterium Rs2_46_30_T18]|nr:ureidoglycolate hydrolase ['Osedax' symbiont bacterium Rs2_46_30_T18]